jgi:hypothetical protein
MDMGDSTPREIRAVFQRYRPITMNMGSTAYLLSTRFSALSNPHPNPSNR